MNIVEADTFTGKRAWDAIAIAELDGFTVRLHWTDKPYIWHVNDGPEIFVVLNGIVDMEVGKDRAERVLRLTAGSIFYAEEGEAHRAVPTGAARVLVIERTGSV
ncbi:cupin domain-containing protein [Acidiphilium sp.]|uniref:cupin domain-containing protein n=1 Tax=Acidiphilium sp. TaxID=527 RepID=UPI00258C7FB8|nr:cupin domain-containing protein [Acidiphilium sp.]